MSFASNTRSKFAAQGALAKRRQMNRLTSLAGPDGIRRAAYSGTVIAPQSAGLLRSPQYMQNTDEDDEPVTIIDDDPFTAIQQEMHEGMRSIRDSIVPSR